MTQPYKAVSWNEEPVSTDKLNTMTNNDQWLFENTPRMKYHGYNLIKTSGLKILATYVTIPPTTATSAGRNLYFGSFFSAGCQPIVVASPASTNAQRRFFIAVNGIGKAVPDNNGAQIYLVPSEANPKNNKIGATVYCHVIAIGW